MLIAASPLIDTLFPPVLTVTGIVVVLALGLSALFVVKTNRRVPDRKRRGTLSRLFYVAFVAMIGVLAVSSFGSVLLFGHMSGYALLAHLAASGSFVFLLLAVAFLYLPRGVTSDDVFFTADHRWWVARWSAWLLVLSSLVTAGTMFLSMLPIFGTEGLLELAALHRYSGLATVVAAVVHVYALVCTKLGLR